MMKRLALLLFALLMLDPTAATAQDGEMPLYETRGTWLTTVWRLDWPPQGSSQFQEQRLREAIRNIKNLGMNTVIFQAVSHAEAMYPSERLPWAHWLTGTPGQDPGYDPLEVAIEEAHALGMELHVWMNVFHVAATTSNHSPTAEPQHVRYAHPEWIVEDTDGTLWGNPGLPDFRQWQVDNVMEVVQNYDLDAIHFDYMRYPRREGLEGDSDLMAQYPNDGGSNIGQWRRENVNNFVRDVYAAVKAEKPWVKVGSAPIGAYKYFNGAPPGYWAWDDTYQEGQVWLAEGVMDYVAPQLYFTIGTAPIPPNTYLSQDFHRWVRNWMNARNDRHVYTGQATYLESEGRFPAGEIAAQIELGRDEGVDGQIHFRYAHTRTSPFGGHYDNPSLPPPMDFLEYAEAPQAPADLTLEYDDQERSITLSWSPAEGGEDDPVRRYAIFRRVGETPSLNSGEDLVTYIGANDTTWTEQFDDGPDAPIAPVEYIVSAQSLLGMLSDGSNVVTTEGTPISSEAAQIADSFYLGAPYPNPTSDVATAIFQLQTPEEVDIRVYDMLGRVVATVADGHFPAGTHRTTIDASALSSGVYLIELTAGTARSVQQLVVAR